MPPEFYIQKFNESIQKFELQFLTKQEGISKYFRYLSQEGITKLVYPDLFWMLAFLKYGELHNLNLFDDIGIKSMVSLVYRARIQPEFSSTHILYQEYQYFYDKTEGLTYG